MRSMMGRPSGLIMIIPAQPPRIVARANAGTRAESLARQSATYSGSTARPGAGDQDDDGRGDAPLARVDADDTSALDDDPRDVARRLDPGAAADRRCGEREGGRVRVGEARLRLPRRPADVVRAGAGEQARQVLGRDELGLDPDALLHRHVAAKVVLVAAAYELHEADRLEAAVATDLGVEVLEDLQALERQPRLVLVRGVHADEGARLARRARGQPPPPD